MRQNRLTRHLWLLFVTALSPSLSLLPAVINWNGIAITEPSAVAPVNSGDVLNISGTNSIDCTASDQHIHINATTADTTVNITADATLQTVNDLANVGALHVVTAAGFTVTFNIDNNFTLRGDNQDLLVAFQGDGNVVFVLEDNKTITFTGNTNGGAAVSVVEMITAAHSPNADFVRFARKVESGTDTFVTFSNGGSLLYAGTDTTLATEEAIVAFDATNNTGVYGRIVLNVGDNGTVGVRGVDHANAGGDFVLADLDFSTRAGNNATFGVLNDTPLTKWSGLVVTNGNKQIVQYQRNPFCLTTPAPSLWQPGFIVGANGSIELTDGSYMDYVPTVTNYTYYPAIPANVLDGRDVNTVVKDRNPSALIVDGEADPYAVTLGTKAQFVMNGTSAMYFYAGVDKDGTTTPYAFSYTINPARDFSGNDGYGVYALEVEGPLDVVGDPAGETALNIMSWHEHPNGGSVYIETTDNRFHIRSYAKDGNGDYQQYAKTCFFVNNRMNYINTALKHDDELHVIYDKNFPTDSEATYIGGESWKLCSGSTIPDAVSYLRRPKMAMYNSALFLHSSAALAGVDIYTPEGSDEILPAEAANQSFTAFYYNGYCVDQGTGRSLILGTKIGSLASDLGTVVDRAAHYDVIQEFAQTPALLQDMKIVTAPNNEKVVEGLTDAITGQFSVHSMYLGYETNISLGTDAALGTDPITGATFTPSTTATLSVDADFISFETQGGNERNPASTLVQGQGAIFVDQNGWFFVSPTVRASIATMIGTTRNAVVTAPGRQVYYDGTIGIGHPALDLSDVTQRVLIAEDALVSDYTLDWKYVTKDTCAADGFVPYILPDVPAACQAPALVDRNMVGLPAVYGTVDQFQIRNSRLGDPAHLSIEGGVVRELLLMTGSESGVAPVANVFVQEDAELGLGTAQRNVDSTQASIKLGINGLTLIANGNAEVFLNEDVLIDNVCHILTGTSFGVGARQELVISSIVPREIRVKNGGVLDLTQFNTANKVLVVGGQVSMVFEPGSRLILGGGELNFTDNARVEFQPFVEESFIHGIVPNATDPYRVKVSGTGLLSMSEDSQMLIPRGALVGVESAGLNTDEATPINCSYVTTMTWEFEDASKLYIGSESDFGGGLQVGNVTDLSGDGGTVDFTLTVNGISTLINVDSQGFLGLGAGIASKLEGAPDNWIISPLFNVTAITVNLTEGTFQANQIYAGSDENASLIAIGNATGFSYNFNGLNSQTLGGSNVIQLTQGSINPTVGTVDGFQTQATIGGGTTTVGKGLLASKPLMLDISKIGTFTNPGTGAQLFSYLKVNPYAAQITRRADLFRSSLGTQTVGYVNGTTINRPVIVGIIGTGGSYVNPTNSLSIGAVGIALDAAGHETIYTITP